jgi:protein FAM50
LDTIRGEFPELKIVSADQLMFVKEDLIIPQHNTFYVSRIMIVNT